MHLLDLDPELGAGMPPDAFAKARDACTVPVARFEPSAWRAPWGQDRWRNCLGFLMLSGASLRQATIAGRRRSLEMLGAGDIAQPWLPTRTADVEILGRVLEPTSVAVLDGRYQQLAAPWPQLGAAIVGRALTRTSSLALQHALSQEPRLTTRIHTLLAHFARRWGTVHPEGITIRARLSHQLIADLVSAQRPSVSVALRALTQAGVITRASGGHWRLLGSASDLLSDQLFPAELAS